MKKLLPLICITSLFLSGCFQEKTYHENGKLDSIGSFKKDKREGEWKLYGNTGKLKGIGSYKDGKAEGDWKWYHENGKLEEIEHYKNNKIIKT